jgi:hypothetical protein
MKHIPPITVGFAMLAASTMGCSSDALTAPAPRDFTVSSALLAAVEDAGLRLLPAVDAGARPAVGKALTWLRAGLLSGEMVQTRAALDALTRALNVGHDSSAGSEAVVAALIVLATAAERELLSPVESPVSLLPSIDR